MIEFILTFFFGVVLGNLIIAFLGFLFGNDTYPEGYHEARDAAKENRTILDSLKSRSEGKE